MQPTSTISAPFLHHFCTSHPTLMSCRSPTFASRIVLGKHLPLHINMIYIYICVCVCVCVYIVVCYSASHAIQKSCHTNSTYFSMQQVFHKSNLMSFHLSFFTSFVAKLPSLLGHFATGKLAPCLCTPWCQGSPSQSNGKIHRSLVFDVTRR